jgi:hypothetical protein
LGSLLNVWLCTFHWHHSAQDWTEHHPTNSKSPCKLNVWQNNSIPDEVPTMGTETVIEQYDTLSDSENKQTQLCQEIYTDNSASRTLLQFPFSNYTQA